MNTASLKLCKELFEVSGWHEDLEWHINRKPPAAEFSRIAPAYDAGFLLRKLPLNIDDGFFELNHYGTDNGYWIAQYCTHDLNTNVFTYDFSNHGDTPEDAACKLVIELFKQGILKREAS